MLFEVANVMRTRSSVSLSIPAASHPHFPQALCIFMKHTNLLSPSHPAVVPSVLQPFVSTLLDLSTNVFARPRIPC